MDRKREVWIRTFYGTENYGSNLQAVGLSETIGKLGYGVCFLDAFDVDSFALRHPGMMYAKIANKLLRKKNRDFFTPVPYERTAAREERLRKFKEEHFVSRTLRSEEEWRKVIDRRTIFAAGSDIIWNPARGYPSTSFLDFAYYAKLPRFSYASSIGAKELPKQFYGAYRRYLGSMVEVGVREQRAADMLEPIIRRKVTKVLDPSLLMARGDWDQFAGRAEVSVPVSEGGFILCYFVMNDPRYWEYVKKVREATGLQVIVLPMHKLDEEQPYDVILDGTPCEFIRLVRDAEFICTDSFHACAISLIYEKEFYLLRRERKAEDDKYSDFLGRYGLTGRTVADESAFARNPRTGWQAAAERLAEDRESSLAFLRETLRKCEG